MPKYPCGVQDLGESPLDPIRAGATITLTEYAPDGAGSTTHNYKILEIKGDTALIKSLTRSGDPIEVKLSFIREHIVRK